MQYLYDVCMRSRQHRARPDKRKRKMELVINSKKLNTKITFSKPGELYIFADLNKQEGSLGKQICVGGDIWGSTLWHEGCDKDSFDKICRNWYRAYCKKN